MSIITMFCIYFTKSPKPSKINVIVLAQAHMIIHH